MRGSCIVFPSKVTNADLVEAYIQNEKKKKGGEGEKRVKRGEGSEYNFKEFPLCRERRKFKVTESIISEGTGLKVMKIQPMYTGS